MKNTIAAIACLIGASAVNAQPAAVKHVRLDEITVAAKEDLVCNVHSIDPVTAPDSGTDVWFIESASKKLGKIDLLSGEVTKFDMPAVAPVGIKSDSLDLLPGDDSAQGPCDFVLDSAGKLWFNHQSANSIGYIDTKAPKTIKLIKLPTKKSLPMSMQMGGDGKIYVELAAANAILRVDPKTEKMEQFALPEKHAGVVGGAADRSGKAHWFILMNPGKLARFDYATKKFEIVPIPYEKPGPFVIRAYDDGLWFTMFTGNAIGHYDPAAKKFAKVDLPGADTQPIGVVLGKDGYLYSNLAMADKVVRIDRATHSVIGEFSLISPKTYSDEIKQGPDGAIWVTHYMGGKITRLWLDTFGKDPGFPQKAN